MNATMSQLGQPCSMSVKNKSCVTCNENSGLSKYKVFCEWQPEVSGYHSKYPLTGRLSDSGPTSPPSKWRCPKCYTMIIPPMGGDHFGMGPGAQRSSVAEIAIFRFFSSDFCFAPGAPIFGQWY